MSRLAISRDLSASLRQRFGAQLLQEHPRIVIAATNAEMVQSAVGMARQEQFRILPLGSGSSFPADYSRLNENTMAILLEGLEGECGGDAFSSWYWAGTRLSRLAVDFPGFFPEHGARATLGGFIADNPFTSPDWHLRRLRTLILSIEVLTATGDFELFAGEGTGTVHTLTAGHLFFGSRGHLGIMVRIRLRRLLGRKDGLVQPSGTLGASFFALESPSVLTRSQLQSLLDPGGLFAWKKEL